jgi:hypothetical protein
MCERSWVSMCCGVSRTMKPALLRRQIGLYLIQAAPMLDDLDAAIRTSSKKQPNRFRSRPATDNISEPLTAEAGLEQHFYGNETKRPFAVVSSRN